ncbi:transposase [Phyllobacterium brassicacearum]|nr:transposase [Phyllobacterium brassicacearum]
MYELPSRFSDEQIIGILKEHQVGLSAADLCRKYGVSNVTFYIYVVKAHESTIQLIDTEIGAHFEIRLLVAGTSPQSDYRKS